MEKGYVLISPCRDEGEFCEVTLQSVLAQTVRPRLWAIVDDGSSDDTPRLLARYAKEHAWIEVITRPDRGRRSVGPGVVDAFYAGYDHVAKNSHEYICKLDLDLELPPRYFEELILRMERNPRLGTCSGKPYVRHPRTGKLVSEGYGDEMSVGMTKLYRHNCFRQIGGFVRQVMWDGIDCHRCRMQGWMVRSFDDVELRFIHLRPEGASQKGVWHGRMRHGFGQYYMGTGWLYMLVSVLYRSAQTPLIVGGFAMALGYFSSMLRGVERYGDMEFRRFLRAYQRACLILGKRRATEKLDARQAGIWRP